MRDTRASEPLGYCVSSVRCIAYWSYALTTVLVGIFLKGGKVSPLSIRTWYEA